MAQITFEKLKQECIREFCSKNFRTHGFPSGANMPGAMAIAQLVELKKSGKFPSHRKFAQKMEDECVAAIEQVDIRNLSPLIELCPDSIPNWIKNKNFILDFTDKGWEFFKK